MRLLVISISLFSLFFILSANSIGRAEFADAGNTGAPWEDGLVCGNCHLGGPYGPVDQSLTLKDPISGQEVNAYMPGKVYDVEITVLPTINPSRYGFQATVLGPDTLNAGIWQNPSNAVQIDSATLNGHPSRRAYVEQQFPGFSPTFRVEWRAPLCDIGPVTFYFIGNAVNNNQSTSGDVGGFGSSRTYQSDIPSFISIDTTDIVGGFYLAEDSISIKGNILQGNHVILGSTLGTNSYGLEIDSSSILEVLLTTCIE